MGGGGKQAAEPKEEINLDTTNFGLWNISDNGYSTFGVGEVLTAIVLVLILAIIAKYCCKRAAVARRSELEETIRANTQGTYRSQAMQLSNPPVAQPQAIPMVTFDTQSGARQVQFSNQAGPVPSYWETCK